MKKITLLFIEIFILSCAIYAKSQFSIYEVLCNNLCSPIGIDDNPSFGWKIHSVERGFKQKAYHIIVSDSEKIIEAGKGNIWDSGICESNSSAMIAYKGKKLQSSTRYYWKVKIWKSTGEESEWSETGMFVTGIIKNDDWEDAKWIIMENEQNAKDGKYKLPLFRKSFNSPKRIQAAFAHVSGLGHFEFYVNGNKVGDNFLDPGWTYYPKTALYVTFDITNMMKEGKNTFGAMLGNGFYNIPRERYYKLLTSYGAPKLKAYINIKYNDGSEETVITDTSWKTASGPITYSSIYGGEDFDARIFDKNWASEDYDDSNWNYSMTTNYNAELKSQQSAPLKVRNKFSPIRQYKNSKGNWIFDFGQNFSGIITIKLKSKTGKEVKLYPGELLNNDSTVNQQATGSPYYWQYTTRGDNEETWSPRFTYYGFRYVEALGIDSLDTFSITGLHTTNSAPEVGHFECSLPMFNKIYELIDWAIRSNLASVLTDCPHREKLGWLEVGHLMMHSMQYRYQLDGLYKKIMGDMFDSQTKEGIIPSICPEYTRFADGFENSPEWGSAFIIVPWYFYKWYKDKSLMEKYYDAMKKYVAYLTSRANNHIVEYGLGDWFDLGVERPGYSQLTSKGVTATAMYYYDVTIMKEIAELCEKEDDKIYFTKLADNIKKAYNQRFYNVEQKTYDRNSQTANAISLYFGLVDKENEKEVYRNLVKDIKSRNNALTSGDIGYRYLLKVLEKNGNSDIIYDMNTKYDAPGYGWQIAYGATALTESWQAYGFVSNNHCMLGHFMEWLFSGLGGISQTDDSAGFSKVLIRPQITKGINSANTSYTSIHGDIISSWQIAPDGKFILETNIPANTEAIVILPKCYRNSITENGLPIENSEGCKEIHESIDGMIKIHVLSGRYKFKIQMKQ